MSLFQGYPLKRGSTVAITELVAMERRRESLDPTCNLLKLLLAHRGLPTQPPLQVVAVPVEAVVRHLLLSAREEGVAGETLRLRGRGRVGSRLRGRSCRGGRISLNLNKTQMSRVLLLSPAPYMHEAQIGSTGDKDRQ